MGVSGLLSADDDTQLFELLNKHSVLKGLGKEYVWVLAGLVGRTIDGLSAKYARYFSGSRL